MALKASQTAGVPNHRSRRKQRREGTQTGIPFSKASQIGLNPRQRRR